MHSVRSETHRSPLDSAECNQNIMKKLEEDKNRYNVLKEMPRFQKYMRKGQEAQNPFCRLLYKAVFVYYRNKNLVEMPLDINIGGGLYLGHPYCITINPKVIIGKNCNIHKGVTIGQENRGGRKGTPIIGNEVWIGVNATIVGAIHIGNDVLIAPNTYVNCDIPDHSIVFGNPCIIKPRQCATEGYINNKVE